MSAAAASSSSGRVTRSQSHKRPRGNDVGGQEDEMKRGPPASRVTASRVHLHRHALESIFACLDLADLATALAVSRDWRAAVGTMHACSLSFSAESDNFMQAVFSELRRHVSDIEFVESYIPRPETLALLHLRMPHLTRISSIGLSIDIAVSSLRLPPSLQELVVTDAPVVQGWCDMLLRSVSGLSHLRRLVLCLEHDASLSFAPLASMAQLRELDINWGTNHDGDNYISQLSNKQVDQLRALADLDSFAVPMTPANAARLLRAPHSLRWRSVKSLQNADDAVCALLPSLRCLTKLEVLGLVCTQFDWLPRMQSLSELKLSMAENHPAADAATQSLTDALRHCPRMSELTLCAYNLPITSQQLAACLPGMPALSALCFHMGSITSLAFLATPSLAQSLRRLWISDLRAPKLNPSETSHLHGLKSLRRLTLYKATATPLDAATLAAFTPPSAMLPLLEHFLYKHAGDGRAVDRYPGFERVDD